MKSLGRISRQPTTFQWQKVEVGGLLLLFLEACQKRNLCDTKQCRSRVAKMTLAEFMQDLQKRDWCIVRCNAPGVLGGDLPTDHLGCLLPPRWASCRYSYFRSARRVPSPRKHSSYLSHPTPLNTMY